MTIQQNYGIRPHLEAGFTSLGLVGPEFMPANTMNTLGIAVENVSSGNTIIVKGRLTGQSSWVTLGTIIGPTTGTKVELRQSDEISFECTVYGASGGTPKLLASGFFNLRDSQESGNQAISALRLSVIYNTDVFTEPGDLLRLTGANFVETVTDNDPDNIPKGIFGVAYDKPTSTTVEVIFIGIVDGYGGFTPGQALYIGELGTPTHTAPLSGTIQQIGFAVSPTAFFLYLGTASRRDDA